MPEEIYDIKHRFTYHAPPDEKVKYFYETYRKMLMEVAVHLNAEVVDCQEKSLAMIKLEEAMFWGNAAVARNGLND